MDHVSAFFRWFVSALGGLLALLEPTLPYVLICTAAILFDCFSAWQLSRRVRKVHPEKAGKEGGKFKSHHAGRVFVTIIKVYALLALAQFIQVYITDGMPINLPKFIAGAICFWQLWSILENESSCNGAKWARIAQKIMIDKTSRHFDIDLSELSNEST